MLSLSSPLPFLFLHLLLWYSKSGDLEEELKNVTNNLKSLEAQAEKVGRALIGFFNVKGPHALLFTFQVRLPMFTLSLWL